MPRRARNPRASTQTSLRLGIAAERIAGLRRERDRLAEKIGKKRSALEERITELRAAADAMFEKIPALLQQQRTLALEVRALFAELLAAGRMPRKHQRAVLDVFETLKEQGMLDVVDSPEDLEPDDDEDEFEQDWYPPFGDEENPFEGGPGSGRRSSGRTEDPGSERDPRHGGFSAAPAGGQADKESVRQLFRRLAMALHPDRTQHEAEKQRRTEAMKEVTRAYEEGDLARLIQLENTLLAGAVVPAQTKEDEDRQITALERMVSDLNRQLKQVERELREVKRARPFGGLEDLSPDLRNSSSPVETLLAQAEEDLKELAAMRDFVKSFRDGSISIAEFLLGPEFLSQIRDPGYDEQPPARRKKKAPARPRKPKAR